MTGKLWADDPEPGSWRRLLIVDACTHTQGPADRIEHVLAGGSAVILPRGECRLGAERPARAAGRPRGMMGVAPGRPIQGG